MEKKDTRLPVII